MATEPNFPALGALFAWKANFRSHTPTPLSVWTTSPQQTPPPPRSTSASAHGRLGDYELLEEIARGGMGVVYKARQISLNRLVAVKMIRQTPLADASLHRRFHLEAEAAAKLCHPNLVPIYEVGQCDGQQFYSMAFVPGQSLSELVREHALPANTAARYVRSIARAIHHAHLQGVLHRDIKPGNVIIDELDEPHVTDFGLAKFLSGDSELTACGTILGSPSYMSPEQAEGRTRAVTARSDVYSIGAVLYELITGRPPFRAETPLQTVRLVVSSDPVPPRWFNPRIPFDLETICLKCLQKEPARRYATAADLADDIERFLSDEPVRARPPGISGRVWRWCKRSPALATAISLAVIAALAGFAGIVWQWQHAERNRALAEERLYAADMSLAFEAISEGNLARARQLRDSHVQAPSNARSFEWAYLQQATRGDDLFSIPGHLATVRQVAFSPDGSAIFSRSVDGVFKVWDARSHRELLKLDGIQSFRGFSADGERLAVNFTKGTVAWLNWRTGELIPMRAPNGLLNSVSPNGDIVAMTSSNFVLRLFDVATDQLRSEINGIGGYVSHPVFQVQRVTLSPNGRLAAGVVAQDHAPFNGDPKELQLFDVASGHRISARAQHSVYDLCFSPDSGFVAVFERQGTVRLIPVHPNAPEPIVLRRGEASFWSGAFSPDGRWLAAGSADNSIYLFDLHRRAPQGMPLRGHVGSVQALAFSSDGKFLVSGGSDGSVRVWPANSRHPIEANELSATPPRRILFSSDGTTIAAEDTQGATRLYGSRNLLPQGRVAAAGLPLAFVGDQLAMLQRTSRTLTLNLTAPMDGAQPRSLLQIEHSGNAERFALSANREWLAVGTAAGGVRLVNVRSAQDAACSISHVGRVAWLEFSSEAQSLVTAGEDGAVQLWDIAQNRFGGEMSKHGRPVNRVAISPDGRFVASCAVDGTVNLRERFGRQQVAPIHVHRDNVLSITFSPDSHLLASCSSDGTVKLWNVRLRQETGTLYFGEAGQRGLGVWSISFSPDGKTLAALGGPGVLKLWRTDADEF